MRLERHGHANLEYHISYFLWFKTPPEIGSSFVSHYISLKRAYAWPSRLGMRTLFGFGKDDLAQMGYVLVDPLVSP